MPQLVHGRGKAPHSGTNHLGGMVPPGGRSVKTPHPHSGAFHYNAEVVEEGAMLYWLDSVAGWGPEKTR